MDNFDLSPFDDASAVPENTNQNWVDAHPGWCCPICKRFRNDIVRLSAKGQTYARIVEHHCHAGDLDGEIIKSHELSPLLRDRFEAILQRFPPIYVCEDCNGADMRAKRSVGARHAFSFTPEEIRQFIVVRRNLNHGLNGEIAKKIYEQVKPEMELVYKKIDELAALVSKTNYYDTRTNTYSIITRGRGL